MIRRHPRFAFTFVVAAAAAAMLTVTGCSSEPTSSSGLEDSAEPHTDLHGDDDSSLPAPNDDPSIGGDDVEIDLGPTAADEADQVNEDESVYEESALDGEIGTSAQALKRVSSPVPGKRVTYRYGVRNPRYAAGFHTGDDYAAPTGRSVVAVRSGRIRWSNNNGGAYGRWIGLDADNGRTYVYCHLSSRLVKAGTRVTAGKRIGRVGATGNVTGPHLHFEDHPKGNFVYARVRKPSW